MSIVSETTEKPKKAESNASNTGTSSSMLMSESPACVHPSVVAQSVCCSESLQLIYYHPSIQLIQHSYSSHTVNTAFIQLIQHSYS